MKAKPTGRHFLNNEGWQFYTL